MKKVVVIPAYNRRAALSLTLTALHKAWQPDWSALFSCDGGRQVISDLALPAGSTLVANTITLGCSLNAFVAISLAIKQGADAILYLEDDIELAPDALQLCDWYLAQSHDSKGVGLALCNKERNQPDDPVGIIADSAQGLLGQGWCFTRRQWFDFALRYWWWYEQGMGKHDTWDWALAYMMQVQGKRLLRPRLSRSRHCGATGFHGASPVFPDVIAGGVGHTYGIVSL